MDRLPERKTDPWRSEPLLLDLKSTIAQQGDGDIAPVEDRRYADLLKENKLGEHNFMVINNEVLLITVTAFNSENVLLGIVTYNK